MYDEVVIPLICTCEFQSVFEGDLQDFIQISGVTKTYLIGPFSLLDYWSRVTKHAIKITVRRGFPGS